MVRAALAFFSAVIIAIGASTARAESVIDTRLSATEMTDLAEAYLRQYFAKLPPPPHPSQATICISIDDKDAPPDLLQRLSEGPINFRPGSECGYSRRFNFSYFAWTSAETAQGYVDFFCPLCGQGSVVVMRRSGGVWRLESERETWVS